MADTNLKIQQLLNSPIPTMLKRALESAVAEVFNFFNMVVGHTFPAPKILQLIDAKEASSNSSQITYALPGQEGQQRTVTVKGIIDLPVNNILAIIRDLQNQIYTALQSAKRTFQQITQIPGVTTTAAANAIATVLSAYTPQQAADNFAPARHNIILAHIFGDQTTVKINREQYTALVAQKNIETNCVLNTFLDPNQKEVIFKNQKEVILQKLAATEAANRISELFPEIIKSMKFYKQLQSVDNTFGTSVNIGNLVNELSRGNTYSSANSPTPFNTTPTRY
jgi:hypothetical protein